MSLTKSLKLEIEVSRVPEHILEKCPELFFEKIFKFMQELTEVTVFSEIKEILGKIETYQGSRSTYCDLNNLRELLSGFRLHDRECMEHIYWMLNRHGNGIPALTDANFQYVRIKVTNEEEVLARVVEYLHKIEGTHPELYSLEDPYRVYVHMNLNRPLINIKGV